MAEPAVANDNTTDDDTVPTPAPVYQDEPAQTESGAEAQWLPKILEEAKKRYPDNPYHQDDFITAATRSARSLAAITAAQDRQLKLTQRGEITKILSTPLAATGVGPRDDHELSLVDPNFQQRLAEAERLNPGIRRYVDNYLKHNISQDNVQTPDRQKNFTRLLGMSNNPNGGAVEFLDVDLQAENLATSDRKKLEQIQMQLGNKLQTNPDVSKILSNRAVSAMLGDSGIAPSAKDKNKEHQYNYFVGVLSGALEDFKAAHKRMPQGDKEIRELVAPLVAETGEKRSWWPWSSNKMQFEPPDKFVDEFAQKFQKKYGRAPSRQEMGVMYERSLRGK